MSHQHANEIIVAAALIIWAGAYVWARWFK